MKNFKFLLYYIFFVYIILLSSCTSVHIPLLNDNYIHPVSYDVEIGKTTKDDIISTFGLGSINEHFGKSSLKNSSKKEGILTMVSYDCGKNSGLMICVNRYGNIICTPCGVPINYSEPYNSISFNFFDNILENVSYGYSRNRPQNFMILSTWKNHATPKSALGNHSVIKMTR